MNVAAQKQNWFNRFTFKLFIHMFYYLGFLCKTL